MTTFLSILAAVGAFFKSVGTFFAWLKERSLRQMGRKEQQLDDLEEINEIRNEADEIEARPPMDKSEQLDWMRNSGKRSENN